MVQTNEERIGRMSAALDAARMDAIVCSLPANVLLISGYWPVVGTSLAIATRDGRICVLAPEDELELTKMGWGEVRAFRPTSLEKITSAAKEVREPLRDALAGFHLHRSRIGYEDAMLEPASYAGMMEYGAGIFPILHAAAPEGQFVPAAELLSDLRAVKTSLELEHIRRACSLAGKVFQEAAERIAFGMNEAEVAALFTTPLGVLGNDGTHRAGGFAFCMSGPNSAQAYGAYARSRARRIRSGDSVLVHCNSYLDGYWTDVTRTYFVEHPKTPMHQVREAVHAARAAALAQVRVGARACEVDRAARQVLDEHGFGTQFKHSTGHGVGFAAIDPNARPRLHPKSEDVLEPGMVFNIEPAVYLEGCGGYRYCDVVTLTNEGVEVLTPFPQDSEQLILAA